MPFGFKGAKFRKLSLSLNVILPMWKFLFTISFVLFSLGCRHSIPLENLDSPIEESSIQYLALGDSYTIGQSVLEENRYPNILTERLMADGVEINAPKIIAKTGWRTDQLKAAIEAEISSEQFDLVSLLIGVNNQFQGRSIEDYKIEFQELLERAIELAQGDKSRVFVLSIPDYAFTPFGQTASNSDSISAEIDAFNLANETISLAFDVSYFDITPISRTGLMNPQLVASDGLHPSGLMYAEWVDLIYDAVLSKLK